MRNIFDQYSQPENRVTHALMTALNEDRGLLERFLRDLVKVVPSAKAVGLRLLEQQYPGEPELIEDDLERRGIPDGWIYDDEGWCLFIESKVLSRLRADQIRSHRQIARRRGFQEIHGLAIVAHEITFVPPNTVVIGWPTVYAWLRGQAAMSAWAARAADYLELAEAQLIDAQRLREGSLTMFAGFPFGKDRPFNYLEGKRVLGLAMTELRSRRDLVEQLGLNPTAPGRPAITGRQEDRVWNFLSLAGMEGGEPFTRHPHLTLNLNAQEVEAMVTVPNAVDGAVRESLKQLGLAGFRTLIEEIVGNFEPLLDRHKGMSPWFRGVQRRYPSQKAVPFIDARIEFDLRTAAASSDGPKRQPNWLAAAYDSYVKKRGSNYQIQVGALFPYDRCPELRAPDAISLIPATWLACKPLLDVARRAATREAAE